MQPARIRVQIHKKYTRVTALGKANRGALYVISDAIFEGVKPKEAMARNEAQRIIIGEPPTTDLVE